jgi:L-ascorbate metabolism protein UlaG (beta-lactamase superfamily)
VTYVGHATVLVELDGRRLLTDPLLRNRIGYLRRQSARVDPACHRGLDAVLISHLHWDHLDLPSLRRMGRDTPLVVPRGAAGALARGGFRALHELAVGETLQLGSVTIEATPALHSGFRPPFGPSTDCLGYVIHGSRTVYFAGDTDLFPEMAGLGGRLDVALLPVWGWGPTLGPGHLDPRRAAEALRLLRPRLAVPIHWGTLCPIGLGRRRPAFLREPPHAFAAHAAELAPEVGVRILAPGEPLALAE